MSHSHMPVRHLLRQVEIYRASRPSRDVRPAWLTSLIERVAELFEPLAGVARVGFDCRAAEGGWNVAMFLGATEVVGGPLDGLRQPTDFEIDVAALLGEFETVERFCWSALPTASRAEGTAGSLLKITGTVASTAVRLEVHAVPPDHARPGFRKYPDGRSAPA